MGSVKAKRHTHKYHKIIINSRPTWACALPDCNHYMPQNMESMALGKGTICWSCGNTMILDEDAMKMDKPICFECANPEAKQVEELFK